MDTLLCGHTDKVTAVKFLPQSSGEAPLILSGSVDKTVRVWQVDTESPTGYRDIAVLEGHESSVNCLAIIPGRKIFASGSADATIRIWLVDINGDNGVHTSLLEAIKITPKYFPLALALIELGETGALVLAAAGTRSNIQIFVTEGDSRHLGFVLRATVTGHEGWIRSLAFTTDTNDTGNDVLLASASQDKYIRLWRIHQGRDLPATNATGRDAVSGSFGKSLSNKAHRLEAAGISYSLTFEALLLGHEDWIYTVGWKINRGRTQLLSASADNSLAIWESDPSSGVWICTTRLGEISAQKGSTTATGSTGGFWIGLWSPSGQLVASLGRTGSWRIWSYDSTQERWEQGLGTGGHVKGVTSISWARDGSYVLSTGSDQTTRLHAEWKRGTKRSWHEFARPQIHGYDINCIDSLGESQFISGADEKLLRVFDEPKAVAQLLERLCGISGISTREMADAADMPVLGLSNKAVAAVGDDDKAVEGGQEATDPTFAPPKATLDLTHPPLEDHLARHTLWPEREKLYGHGHEISAVAASHDGAFVATACRASSIDHAVIRLYDTREWRENKPPLTAHSLTVTRLQFSDDDRFLLSVGRDRQWTVFERGDPGEGGDEAGPYQIRASNSKGHSRMILDAAWAPQTAARCFATASRDKSVKIWVGDTNSFACQATVPVSSSATAVAFLPQIVHGLLHLAIGTENGEIIVYFLNPSAVKADKFYTFDKR